jgi:two-component system, OmpR family, sensor histidine kinase KdpD
MTQKVEQSLPRRVLRIVGSLLIVGAITFIYRTVILVNSTTTALTLLLAILGVATFWGLAEAIIASLAGMLCFNFFFLPPVGTLTIADPQNWVALFAFLVTSVAGSELSARAKRRALESMKRQQEMERLYELSRNLLLLDQQSPAASQVASRILQVFDLPGVAVFDREEDRVYRAGAPDMPVTDSRLRDTALQSTAFYDSSTGLSVLPLKLGGGTVGSLAMIASGPGGSMSDAAVHAVANLAAIAAEKARAEGAAGRIEATRQNEVMKATLLDALAHEFTTPLTSIKAAASSILDEERSAQQELVTIIEEETDRLTSLVSETIRMARIEAGRLHLNRQTRHISDLVAAALENVKPLMEDRPIQIEVSSNLPAVRVDFELIALTIRQLLTNALKYSNPDSPIFVGASVDDGWVTVRVRDQGAGIPDRERARIFEKFYRVPDRADRVPGTGMGLHIAREIIRAHGGEIGVNSVVGEGSEFFFTLPAAEGNA